MRIERALKIRDAAMTSLRDLLSQAEHFGLASQDLETRRHACLERHGVHKAPRKCGAYS